MVHGEGDLMGQKVTLRPDQVLFQYQWNELDTDGGWFYDEGYYEAPSGVGKTQEKAWVALEALLGPSRAVTKAPPNIVVQANSKDQAGEKKGDDTAEGIFGRCVQVVTHPACPLRDYVSVLEDRIVMADGSPGRILLVAAKGSTNDGKLPTLYIGDEVQDWAGQAADSYDRMSKGTTKTRSGRALSGSTPGAYSGMPTVGWTLHERGERGDDPRFLYRSLAAPREAITVVRRLNHAKSTRTRNQAAAQLRTYLRECNPGIDDYRLERLVRRATRVPLSTYCRFHLGLWMDEDKESWLHEHEGAWDRCTARELTIPKRSPIGVAVDAALNRDSMSVAWAARVGDRVVVRAKIWTPEPNRAVDITQARLFILEQLARDYQIIHVAYDAKFFVESATALADAGVATMDVPQTIDNLGPADVHLFELILDATIAHDGDHDLAQQVNAAVKRTTERGWLLSKGRSTRPIDACRAVSMAVAALDLWQPEQAKGGFFAAWSSR